MSWENVIIARMILCGEEFSADPRSESKDLKKGEGRRVKALWSHCIIARSAAVRQGDLAIG